MRILIVEDGRSTGIAIAQALCSEQQHHCIALNFELMPSDAAELPEWIELLPAGQVITGRDGRTWINDRPEAIMAAFAAEGKDLPIDWEHSTQLKAPKGEHSPAAGWIKQIEQRDNGGMWARVEWTEQGASSVMSREYRYISPVFQHELETNRIFRIVSCGLTNQPNLYLNALNHEQTEDLPMLKKLLLVLGLPETTTEDVALNHVATLKADCATALNQAKYPPLDKFVPKADYDTALNRATTAEAKLAGVETAALETAINTEIDAALKAGKITPATKDYHIAQCRQEGGLDRFKAFVSATPVIAGPTGLDTRTVETGAALNAEEKAACVALGVSEEDYRKANQD